ncbi:STY0301 family protein [Roseixanthobacter glucoisosaccharinicivorans]|uniref:STY0301 family protein n=1 Tax=Roseixanthobacter glucoisosaccharinicivorans TaxID=3119923 RepID=UPI00372AB502
MPRAAVAFLGALVGVLVGSAAAWGAVECPASMDGHPLERVSVFDGPPSEMVDLRPDGRGRTDVWADLDKSDRPATLVCRYKNVSRTFEFVLAAGTRTCEGVRRADETYRSIVCR